MIRSAASKVMWVGRATVFLVGLAVILALWLALLAGPAEAQDCIAPCDTTPPTVTSVSPADGATNVSPSANVTATFSETMDSLSITTSTFTLVRQGTTTPVSATVSYNNTTRTATLDPDSALFQGATYTATVKGGDGGVTDFWGNPLTSDKVWSFTVPDITPPSVTLTSPSAGTFVKGAVTLSATAADNLGVITRVEFFVRGNKVGEDISSPFGMSWISTSVSDGSAAVTARAWDGAGNSATSSPVSVTIDNTAPDTALSSTPADPTNQTTANFSWTGSDTTSTTESLKYSHKLDSGEWSPFSTDTSISLTGLGEGSHTFSVRAMDQAGNVDSSPAEHTWTVDTGAPETAIASGPSDIVRSTAASFGFISNDAGSTFKCSLDGGAFISCTSPKSYSGLSNGRHTFRVAATDVAGNLDTTPAARTWTVDTIKPTVSGMSPRHKSIIRDATPTIAATVKDRLTNLQKRNIKLYVAGKAIPASKFRYSAATDKLIYNSPKLSKGKKTVKIVAADAAKNVGTKSWFFTIK